MGKYHNVFIDSDACTWIFSHGGGQRISIESTPLGVYFDQLSMDQENGTNQPVRRTPTTSGSVFLIVIILFMMFGGESQRVSQGDLSEHCKVCSLPSLTIPLEDSLQSLVDEHSNYTAFLEGRPTNFTLVSLYPSVGPPF